MIESAYNWVEKGEAFVTVKLSNSIYTVNPSPENAFLYKGLANKEKVFGNSVDSASIEKKATIVSIENNGKTISLIIHEPSIETELRVYNSSNAIASKVQFTLIEQKYNNETGTEKKTKNVLSIDSNGYFRVWRDTFEWDFGTESMLKARIIDPADNSVKCLLTGYHVHSQAITSYYYSSFPNIIGTHLYGGIDIYKHLYMLEPLTDKEYHFVGNVGSNREVFVTSVFYSTAQGNFYKPLPSEELWRNIGTVI